MLDTPLRIIQANTNRGIQATESLLEYAVEKKVDILLIQEPWIFRNKTTQYKDCCSINHPSFMALLPPHDNQTRPRTLVYTSRLLQLQITPIYLENPDCQTLEIRDTNGARLQLVNLYNERDKQGVWTVDRCLYQLPLLPDSVIVGDFNTKHPAWDNSSGNTDRGEALCSWIEEKGLLLQNPPGVGTFFRPHMEVPSVLDLCLTRGALSRQELNWHTIDFGSDHLAISITIPQTTKKLQATAKTPIYNTRKANWELFHSLLLRDAGEIQDTPDLETLATSFSDFISRAADTSIPKSQRSSRSKP